VTQWSITEQPAKVGLSWSRLGDDVRQPFHLYFDVSEAMEVFDIVQKIEVVSAAALEKVVPVDHARFEDLSKAMHPKRETINTGALVFFISLVIDLTEDEESEAGSNPSREEVKGIQSLVVNSQGPKNIKEDGLDRSVYYDAENIDDYEPPLASSRKNSRERGGEERSDKGEPEKNKSAKSKGSVARSSKKGSVRYSNRNKKKDPSSDPSSLSSESSDS